MKLRHPLIVSVECAFIDFKYHHGYLQFEKLECNLDDWMRKEVASGPQDIMKVCHIINTLIQAVAWVHSQDVVHCDIKPSNFLWDSKMKLPRLHDFETAREVTASSESGGTTTRIHSENLGR